MKPRKRPSLFFAAMPIIILSLVLYQSKPAPTVPIQAKAVTTPATTATTVQTTMQEATTTAKATEPPVEYTGALPEFLGAFPLDENGTPRHYVDMLSGVACAYTAKPDAITSTGTTPRIGTVAVNPKLIPYGSKLFIVSDSGYVYGYAIAEDTGGDLLNNTILVDLYMDTREDCLEFGRRRVTVYILE